MAGGGGRERERARKKGSELRSGVLRGLGTLGRMGCV